MVSCFRTPALLPVLLLAAGCPDTTKIIYEEVDSGVAVDCPTGQLARFGVCLCVDDTGCPADQYCQAVTGQCLPRGTPAGKDASFACTSGARRCKPGAGGDAGTPEAVQECQNGSWVDVETCDQGYCAAAATGFYCTICNNGTSHCVADQDDAGVPILSGDGGVLSHAVTTCSEKGDEWITTPCPPEADGGIDPSQCVNGRCQACSVGEQRCSPDGTSVDTCKDGFTWISQYCNPTGKCVIGPASGLDGGASEAQVPQCVPPFCNPGVTRCKGGGDTVTIETCLSDGSGWKDQDCRSVDQYATQNAICKSDPVNGDACYDPCADAARNSSYQGCDYWATTTSNSELGSMEQDSYGKNGFKGGANDGQQTDTPSDFAVVVSNPNGVAAHVQVYRLKNSAEQLSPTIPAQSASGLTVQPNQLMVIYLPWQAVSQTGQQPFGFHVVSDLPVSAYQFNPLDNYTPKNAATIQVNANGICTNCSQDVQAGECVNCAYSNDASLLIPGHILGSSYVVLGQEHITLHEGNSSTNDAVPAFFSVVAAEDNTLVTIKFSAATLANTGQSIGAQAKNSIASYHLKRYDVLQFWSDSGSGGIAETFNFGQCNNMACVENGQTCLTSTDCWVNQGFGFAGFDTVTRYNSDPTGTVILASDVTDPTKPKPVAVFSGADCTFKPFSEFACDHIEEMMLPFSTWGKNYVGLKSVAYKDASGNPTTSKTGDYWRVVGGCGVRDCANGTKVTITPAPGKFITNPYSSNCTTGGGSAVCQLPGIDPTSATPTAPWVEFTATGDFTVAADQPIMLAQYFTGEDNNPKSAEGDPSLVLTPPVEQWRASYNVLTAPTLVHNYIALVAQPTNGTPIITIDGNSLDTAHFPGMQSSLIPPLPGQSIGFVAYKVPVKGGAHQILSSPISADKGAAPVGVTIYGYDNYVSYGYTGGLDLKTITEIIPGG